MTKTQAERDALELLRTLRQTTEGHEAFSTDDASERTLRYRAPAEFDPLKDWLDKNGLKFLELVDAVLPGTVARRNACKADGGWRDPVEWISLDLPYEPDHTILDQHPGIRPWFQLEGIDYEGFRANLLAIVEHVAQRVEAGGTNLAAKEQQPQPAPEAVEKKPQSTAATAPPESDSLRVSLKDAALIVGNAPNTVTKLEADGNFPPRVKVTDRKSEFIRKEVVAWGEGLDWKAMVVKRDPKWRPGR